MAKWQGGQVAKWQSRNVTGGHSNQGAVGGPA